MWPLLREHQRCDLRGRTQRHLQWEERRYVPLAEVTCPNVKRHYHVCSCCSSCGWNRFCVCRIFRQRGRKCSAPQVPRAAVRRWPSARIWETLHILHGSCLTSTDECMCWPWLCTCVFWLCTCVWFQKPCSEAVGGAVSSGSQKDQESTITCLISIKHCLKLDCQMKEIKCHKCLCIRSELY